MTSTREIEKIANQPYRFGFDTRVEMELAPVGLNEDIIRLISRKKSEPAWMLEWRLRAFRHWLTMTEPKWSTVVHPAIDYQAIHYYAAPKALASLVAGTAKDGKTPQSFSDVDPEIRKTFDKLGISLAEQKRLVGVAVDAVFDSVSVATSYKGKLKELGIIFCSFSEAAQLHPDLVKRYLGSVVPYTDNFFATLNSAVFTDGSFVFVPRGVKCPMELSSYFRINAAKTGQFERTLIIAEPGASLSYVEGCTAPMRDENQLHAAVVELVAMDDASIKYSTVQNWYPGDKSGLGGVYNFVTKRGKAIGRNSRISWTQIETGSAITWKYPSCLLMGEGAVGEFYSVAVTANHQQADTGTKMMHLGANTRSTIIAKGISTGHGKNSYRGLVRMLNGAKNARNSTRCDSLLIGANAVANTIPYLEIKNNSAQVEHEATTTKIGEDQLFYLQQRGLSHEDAMSLIVNGFCRDVMQQLPMEFAVEARRLLGVSLEGATG